jgi:hypothetical protein
MKGAKVGEHSVWVHMCARVFVCVLGGQAHFGFLPMLPPFEQVVYQEEAAFPLLCSLVLYFNDYFPKQSSEH